MRIFLLVFSFFLLHISVYSQQDPLPVGFAPGELESMERYLESRMGATRGITFPPNGPVRTMAEWEEIEALVITWTQFQSILRDIVRYAQEECEVIIVCNDSNQVKTYLQNGGVPDQNISFLQEPFNTIWMRDYGANTVYKRDVDSLILVDWIYNRPRPRDDDIPDALADFTGYPIYSTTTPPYDLVHTGGNFMSDGFGTGFSSRLVVDENGPGGFFNPTSKTEAEIDTLMKQFMGIETYVTMPVLPYDGIHHIDMHMKLLDEETILVGEYPFGIADGPQIEQNINYIQQNFTSVFGTPYKIVRIPMPPENGRYPNQGGDYRTYTNSVFVNKTILVPTYEQRYDTTALRIMREQLPGYRVVGINCNSIIQLSGALHCITKAIGAANPLLISHQPLKNSYYSPTGFEVNALIKHIDGIQAAMLYYTTDTTQAYTAVPMNLTDTLSATWTGHIPSMAEGQEVFYYVHAEATTGKQMNRPMPAPKGYWKFRVLERATSIDNPEKQGISLQPIYPNPSQQFAHVPVFSREPKQGSIILYDLTGKKLQTVFEGDLPFGPSNYLVETADLAPGTYFVSLEVPSGRQVQRLVVQ